MATMTKANLKKVLRRGDRKEYKYFLFFGGVAIVGFILFYLLPIIRTVILSFTDTEIFSLGFSWVGWDNYLYALTDDYQFWNSIKLSLIFATASGLCVLVTSMILAMLMNTKVKGIGIFRTIYFIPFIIPSFAVGAVYKNFFNPYNGLVNQILGWIGIVDPPLWYIVGETALLTMILISAMGFGVKMLVFLAALQGIPNSLYEVAAIEGATPVQKFMKITLPLISPMLFFNVILITIDGMKAFSLAFVMGNGQGWPSNSTLLFPIYMFMTAFNTPFKLGYAASMALLFFLLILALTGFHFLMSKYYVEKDITV